MTDDSDIRVQLARMEGAINLTNEQLRTVNSSVGEVKQIQREQGQRITVLESQGVRDRGQREGIGLAAKVVWTLGGGGVVAALALLARALGA